MSYADLEMKVIQWAEARKIIPNSTPLAQTRKTLEEAGELLEAATEINLLRRLVRLAPELDTHPVVCGLFNKAMDSFKDAAGDTYVTVINACALADVDPTECLAGAYEQIKDRKGTLLPNGIFQKEQA